MIELNELELLELAKSYLDKGLNKDFYLHTEGVLRAAKGILAFEKGDPNIVIPAVVFHDTGWALVPPEYQGNVGFEKARIGMEMHLEKGAEVAGKELLNLKYDPLQVQEIQKVIKSHKFSDPKDINSQILIDADNLSDIYIDQFKSDLIHYEKKPDELLEHRLRNTFYFNCSREIFNEELKKIKREYGV